MTEAERLLKEFLDYLEIERNRSLRTRQVYDRYLRAFFSEAHITRLSGITPEAVKAFRLHLARKADRGGTALKKNTQSYYAIAIRNFLRYLRRRGFSVPSPDEIELPRLPIRQIEILEYADLERLLAAPRGESLRALRDRAILELFFSTGLRLSELCRLDRWIDLKRGEITVRGKGEKLRLVFLSKRATEAMKRYLDRRSDTDQALFVSLTQQGKPLGRISSRAVERLIEYWGRRAGLPGKRVTPHSLRHQFATDLLINGADLRSVQALLGHAHIGTTQIYTHLTNQGLKEVHRSFHGRRRR